MPVAPVLITRSIVVLSTKKDKQLVSCSFIARFADGSEKVLNSKKWQPIGLLRESDIGDAVLSANECSLYFKDWSKNPVRGTMAANMPPSLLPTEIMEVLN
jgi:hypothetical protein